MLVESSRAAARSLTGTATAGHAMTPELNRAARAAKDQVRAQHWGRRVRNYIVLDSKVLGIELAAHTRRSFNSSDREPIVRQQRRRCFYPCIFLSRI